LFLNCLTYWPNKGLFDTAVFLCKGVVDILPEQQVLRINSRRFY